MCGIIGSYISNNDKDLESKLFKNGLNQIKHRGPDYQENIDLKLNNNNRFLLGFCRLSIQDLSRSANKIFRDQNNVLLFNGEIYNHLELKKKYFNNKYFQTNTDTEFLFNFLKRYGMEKIDELDGMFAFAWIDLKIKKLFLARDRTGVKTLYYYYNNKNFHFCSEAWYLYENLKEKKINFNALNFYLRYGFNHNQICIAKNIFKVQPGEILEYNLDDNILKFNTYLKNENTLIKNDYENLDNDLADAVKLNLISDVKIGTFLSGGIDSSIITILSNKFNKKIDAFTNYFNDQSFYKKNYDFLYAEKLCKNFDIRFNYNLINIDQNTKDNFFNVLSFFDEPLANLNILNSFLQAKTAKEMNIKVILTGDGADEIFGGYTKYVNTKISDKFYFLSFLSKKIRQYQNYDLNFFPLLFFEKFNDQDIKNLFKSEVAKQILESNSHFYISKDSTNRNFISNNFDFKCWLTGDHNFKLDRTLMANSIEGRVPFQSNNIIKKYYHIDINKKINFFNTKIQLRKNNILPNQFNQRPKQGWHLPEKWFVNNIMKDSFFELVDKSNFLNHNQAKDLFNKSKYPKIQVYKIITLYMLMYWNRKTNFF